MNKIENKFSKYNLNINDNIEWIANFTGEPIKFTGKVKIIANNHLIVKDSHGRQHTIINPKTVKLKKIEENLDEQKVRSIIQEIINNPKSYNPYSMGEINFPCDQCGLPSNCCECGAVDKSKMARVSGMQQLKEFINKEIKLLLKEKKKG